MSDRARTARSPGLVYSATTVAMVVLIGAIALTVRQVPPPPVAEFAPQVQQIKEAPLEQTTQFGSGPGAGGGVGGAANIPTPEPKRGVKVVPRQLRCVGNPPRQIEDPQSPPCIPFWQGFNGGATVRGVTADEIRVMIPTYENDDRHRFYEALRKFFNARFQLYGRQLTFVYGRGDLGAAPCAGQKREAAQADAQRIFASTFYRAAQGFCYHEELARRRILSVTGAYFGQQASYLEKFSPYLFQYLMPADEMFANLGEWACKNLKGRPARYGDPAQTTRTRVFGVIQQTYYDQDPTTTAALERELAGCGQRVTADRKARNAVRQGGDEDVQSAAVDPATSNQVVLKMKTANVTSIFCACQLFTFGALAKAASNQGYFPEWIISTYGPLDIITSFTLGAAPPEQLAHAFGLDFDPIQVPIEYEPFYWANKEGDPAHFVDPSAATVHNRQEMYRPLLLLVSGIQMAGPRLTYRSFAEGLWKTVFPNPDHIIKAGKVGFAGHRLGMTTDGAEFWWSNTARSPYAGGDQGTFCYVAGARRYAKTAWPSHGDGVFFRPDTECFNGTPR
jgi:hypothetical protein